MKKIVYLFVSAAMFVACNPPPAAEAVAAPVEVEAAPAAEAPATEE